MHNDIVVIVQNLLPGKRKTTPSGWTSFNAVCCVHNGETIDKRGRGGIIINNESIAYKCFNCKFTASWAPGRKLSKKFKNLLGWLGANEDLVNRLEFEALKFLNKPAHIVKPKIEKSIKFEKFPLPENYITFDEMVTWGAVDKPYNELAQIVRYAANRKIDAPRYRKLLGGVTTGPFSNRLIIQFRYHDEIVGYTARRIDPPLNLFHSVAEMEKEKAKLGPKYLSSHDHNFIFNLDEQTPERKFIVVCEGPIDALSVGGIATCGNEITNEKARIINSLNRRIIVVADSDRSGIPLIKAALEYGWNVSTFLLRGFFKDINEAVVHNDKVSVLKDIIDSEVTSELKIKLLLKDSRYIVKGALINR